VRRTITGRTETLQFMCAELQPGMHHMHEKRIVPGGLRFDNIMMDKNVWAFAGSQYSRPNEFRGTVSLETTFGLGFILVLDKSWDRMRIRHLMFFHFRWFYRGWRNPDLNPRWIDNTELIKSVSPDLNSCPMFDSHIPISARLFH
jgi:hypothetical protein